MAPPNVQSLQISSPKFPNRSLQSLSSLELFQQQQPPTTPKHRGDTAKSSSATTIPDHHNLHRQPSSSAASSSSCSQLYSSTTTTKIPDHPTLHRQQSCAAAATTSSSCSQMYSTPFLVSFLLLLSIPALFLLAPRFLPPSNHPIPISPADELDDQILFTRALNPKPAFSHLTLDSRSSKPKIAFLFLTNTDLHFAPLWVRFFSKANPNLYNIYVHADPTANVTLPKGTVFENRLVPSKRTYRASPTLISATRRLLASAVIDDPANLFFAVCRSTASPSTPSATSTTRSSSPTPSTPPAPPPPPSSPTPS